MSCVALILAAGQETIGVNNMPKPFVSVQDKPVLMYTLEVFEQNPMVDSIHLVCLDGWTEIARAYARQYNISKLGGIVTGGESVQETIFKGLLSLKQELLDDDLVIVHDGIRPLVEDSVLNDVIKIAEEKGNAVSSMPNNEQVFVVNKKDPRTTVQFIPRETIKRVSTPQAYHFGELLEAYEYAFEHSLGIVGPQYADTLFSDLGKKIYFSAGSDKNIKMNTEEDLRLFEAYLNRSKDLWLK